ncbi:PREDICTED: lymphocyte antigen 6E-like [Apaloderma vittatum]|uniref:lymphocyte antigen 6E-like n=1 Tax=Apaloderma vittatum TaxID=57397 RepID=UPI000521CD84|nr:PREDICTED: lymphocyte antigen 6E-like [Apaloderma vittatum]
MKTTLVTLLAAVLCVEQAHPLMCYVCEEQESNDDCMTISMCAEKDNYCLTVRNTVGTKPNKLKYVISKMCSPTCPDRSHQENQTYQSIYCCEKALCNVNGVSSKQSSYGVMLLGVLASITYTSAHGL